MARQERAGGAWVFSRDGERRDSTLMKTYRNIPMSLADACLIRMAGIHENAKVMTLDSDFGVYRKSRLGASILNFELV
jgi:predicted nucleic acid-binding protein